MNAAGATLDSDKQGYSPLHSAAFHGASKSILFLLKQGISVDLKDKRNNTPLMSAMTKKDWNTNIVSILLDNKAYTKLVNIDGNTCLHVAAALNGHVGMVDEVVHHGCVDINAPNNEGHTPIMVAARYSSKPVFDFLLKKGARITPPALHLACMGESIR